jgi:hypothetical protein
MLIMRRLFSGLVAKNIAFFFNANELVIIAPPPEVVITLLPLKKEY